MDNKNPNPLHSPHIQALRQLMQKDTADALKIFWNYLRKKVKQTRGKSKK